MTFASLFIQMIFLTCISLCSLTFSLSLGSANEVLPTYFYWKIIFILPELIRCFFATGGGHWLCNVGKEGCDFDWFGAPRKIKKLRVGEWIFYGDGWKAIGRFTIKLKFLREKYICRVNFGKKHSALFVFCMIQKNNNSIYH